MNSNYSHYYLIHALPLSRRPRRPARFSVLPASTVLAQTAGTDNSAAAAQLPTVDVVADGVNDTKFKATQSQVNKSTTPLSQTPQSVSVVTRSMLDSQQAVSLADALENVPGVVAQQYGRRGWDDLIIRGQVASDSLYLDGLHHRQLARGRAAVRPAAGRSAQGPGLAAVRAGAAGRAGQHGQQASAGQ
jgi:outer membrane receptor for monomeric catechols